MKQQNQQTATRIVSSPFGLPWRASPFLPIESMAARQHSFLVILATAYEQQLPIAPLIAAFSLEHRRRFRSRLIQFSSILHYDPCIASALEQTPELLPDETVTAISLGTELGTLSATFAQLIETDQPRADDVQEKWNSVICYLIVLLPTLGMVSLGFCFFIVPTFKRMFDEFELKLPQASLLYLAVADIIAVAFAPCLFLCLVFAALYLFTPLGLLLRRFYRRYLPGAYSARSRRSVLQLLALSQHGNSLLKTAISTLARIHTTPAVRRRFQRAGRKIESGGDPWHSLADQQLVSHQQSQSLSAMQESEMRNWTLLRLADGKQIAERRRAYTFVSLVQPITILLIALAVLWTCVMCFGPLVSLVTSLT